MNKETNWLLREKYKNKPTKDYYKDVEKLKAGEPVDYVIGFTEFLGCKIDLSKRPLIPRKETEYWVGQVLGRIKNGKVLDIFSGSGCIGIALLKHNKNLFCDFVDEDEKATKQIKINCKLNNISKKRYKIIKSDVFSRVEGNYDYIFANPPYISKENLKKVYKSVLKYEPKKAIFGGIDGLFYIRKFLKEAKNHLKKNRKIFMEFDCVQKKDIEKIIENYGYKACEFHRDQYGKWRQVMIKLK